MKSIVISALMLSMTLFFVSCENEGQPTESASDVETQILDKKPQKGELITFTGHLEGSQVVEGCCPNAGPFPEYTMTLSGPLPAETYEGNIFMNRFGRRLPWNYKVSFWWTENNGQDTTLIIVRGGNPHKDKRTKILTVTFEDDTCWIYYPNGIEDTVYVTFTLTRGQAPQ